MAENSAIAWTKHTANFWMGCDKVSPGCAHCYAETLTVNKMGLKVWGPESARQEVKSIWPKLSKWDAEAAHETDALPPSERTRVFVMSLGDFMEDHPDANRIRVKAWDAMRATKHLLFLILTKRPENYARFLPDDWMTHPTWRRAWLGASVENDRFVHRAETLKAVDCQSGIRWLSVEPLLGPVPSLDIVGINWIIVGGESGPGYRPMDHAWARDLRDRCVLGQKRYARLSDEMRRSGHGHPTAFFMKQSAAYRTEMGTYLEEPDGSRWAWKQYPGELVPPVQVR